MEVGARGSAHGSQCPAVRGYDGRDAGERHIYVITALPRQHNPDQTITDQASPIFRISKLVKSGLGGGDKHMRHPPRHNQPVIPNERPARRLDPRLPIRSQRQLGGTRMPTIK